MANAWVCFECACDRCRIDLEPWGHVVTCCNCDATAKLPLPFTRLAAITATARLVAHGDKRLAMLLDRVAQLPSSVQRTAPSAETLGALLRAINEVIDHA